MEKIRYIEHINYEITKLKNEVKKVQEYNQKQIDFLESKKKEIANNSSKFDNKCYITEENINYITYSYIKHVNNYSNPIENCEFINAEVLNVNVYDDGTYSISDDVDGHVSVVYYNHSTKEYESIKEITKDEFNKIFEKAILNFRNING